MIPRTRVVIAIPALNEERTIGPSVRAIRSMCDTALPDAEAVIVIADNGSSDGTPAEGARLAFSIPGVRYLRLEERGKGRAIRAAWESDTTADIYAFMDADLSTDLSALPALMRGIQSGADAVVGSRALRGAVVNRTPLRRALSFGYRTVLSFLLGSRVTDAPCGFKAFSSHAMKEVLPRVGNLTWFFDSEILLRAERAGMRIREIPVRWHDARPEGSTSKVRVRKIVFEYVREILRLRAAFTREERDPSDYRAWKIASAGLIVATSIAPAFGWWNGSRLGLEWIGRQTFSPGDTAAYLSYIAQARDGAFALANLATTEVTRSVPNAVWWLGGIIARLSGVSPLGAFHLLRIGLIPVALAVFFRALRWFVRDGESRRMAFWLLCFGSGAGALVSPLYTTIKEYPNGFELPTDLWVSESNVFASATFSPHFVASWMLIVMVCWLLSRALAKQSLRDAAFAGVAALTLFSFHPFYVVTGYAYVAALLILWYLREGWQWRRVWAALVFVAASVPAAAYHAWLAWYTPNGRFMIDTNLLLTPSAGNVALGFGGFLLFAVPGYLRMREGEDDAPRRAQELLILAGSIAVLLYAPFSFQRRLMEGLQFPLAAFSGVAIVAAARRARMLPRYASLEIGGAFLLVTLFTLSSFSVVMRDVHRYATEDEAYFTEGETRVFAWIRSETPRNAAFLSVGDTGNGILGWGEPRTYLGHWALTPDAGEKVETATSFFGEMTSSERVDFMRTHGLSYVYAGPRERSIGGDMHEDPGFTVAYDAEGITVYELR